MKQTKIWNIICCILWGLLAAVEGLTYFTISRLNMLPDQYMMLLGGGLLILWVLMGLLLIPGKNNTGSVRRIVAAFLILVHIRGRIRGQHLRILRLTGCIVIEYIARDPDGYRAQNQGDVVALAAKTAA